ncbi:MAG: ferredoxin [Saprospiraceae bacterium]|nr:ferredoxin [Saprospiraceae bacterium]
MVVITLQREKCIGCNYCAELDPANFRMSKKDGKSVLLHSTEKRGFHTVKLPFTPDLPSITKAADACPVKIIQVKEIGA